MADQRASEQGCVHAADPAAMTPLVTERELEVLEAFRRHGSWKRAAHELGMTMGSAKYRATVAYRRLGVDGWNQAFRKLGWLA